MPCARTASESKMLISQQLYVHHMMSNPFYGFRYITPCTILTLDFLCFISLDFFLPYRSG